MHEDSSQFDMSGPAPELAVIAVAISAALVVTSLLVVTRVNTQSIAALLGVVVGLILRYLVYVNPNYSGFRWDPWNVLALYFPIQILKLGFCIEYAIYRKALLQILLVVLLGYPMSIFLIGTVVSMGLSIELHVLRIVIIGVVATSIDIPDGSYKFEHKQIMDGLLNAETILGNGFCLTIIGLALGVYERYIVEWYQMVAFIVRDIIMAIIIGFVLGNTLKLALKWFYNDVLNTSAFMVASVYTIFYLCERIFFCSGSIAVFIVVLCFAQKKDHLSRQTRSDVEAFLRGAMFVVIRVGYFVMFVKNTFRIVPLNGVLIIFEALAMYVAATASRFLTYAFLIPFLSRMGHGFGFTSYITILWAPKKGPVQHIMIILMLDHPVKYFIEQRIFGYWYYFLIFSNFINLTTVGLLMKKVGFLELSKLRRQNITNCFQFVNDKCSNQIILLKMNRFYSGVNWPLVYSSTALVSDLTTEEEVEKQENRQLPICPICLNEIMIKMTKEELLQLTREAQLRILKTEKISFMYQFEEELISYECLKKILILCEAARESVVPTIKLDDLLFCLRNKYLRGPVSLLQRKFLYTPAEEYFRMPIHRTNRWCYRLASHKWFEVTYFVIIIANLVISVLGKISIKAMDFGSFISISICHLFFLIYLAEFLIKLLAHSYINIKMGFKNFWRYIWNRIDLAVLVLNAVELLGIYALIALYFCGYVEDMNRYIGIVQYSKAIRLLRVLKILSIIFPSIPLTFNQTINKHLVEAYSIGTALVIGYEEVLDTLSTITHMDNLREFLRASLLADKSAITKELGNLNSGKPQIALNLQTHQAISLVLKCMTDALSELKIAGLVDAFEFKQIQKLIARHRKSALALENIDAMPSKTLLHELPWLGSLEFNESEMIQLIDRTLRIKIWEAGQVICNEGQYIEGVFLITYGLMKATYIPSEDYIEDLNYSGKLPIKDYQRNRCFQDLEENFILVGNTIGELSVLTNRPSSCKIISEQPTQAFIIPREVIKKAILISDDPVFGLECRMWKCLSLNLVRRILKATKIYSSKTNMELNDILNRAFVPDLRCFTLFVVNKFIQDIVLIEGLIVDCYTRSMITAPAYIPRSVHKMILSCEPSAKIKASNLTKLLLIPVADIDEYQVMVRSEEVSELVNDHSNVCLLTGKNMISRRRKRIKGVKNVYHAISSLMSSTH